MIDYVITGGNGFIGRNLTNFLSEKGKSFKIVDTDPCHKNETVCIDTSFRIPAIDACNLIHLASETNVRTSIKYPRHTIEKNCKSILNCLELVSNGTFKSLTFTSSASSQASLSPYLASKSSCEAICKAYKNSYGLDIKILKLSNVYGPHSGGKSSVIARFIKNCINKKPLIIYGDGSQQRDFIHVSDVVDAIYEGKEGFIASGILATIRGIAFLISDLSEEILNYRPRIVYEQPIQGEVKAMSVGTDIEPKINLEQGIRSTFKWLVGNYEPE